MRIYTAVDEASYGLIVYFHGGAFFLGSLDTHDHVARSWPKRRNAGSFRSVTDWRPSTLSPPALRTARRWFGGSRRTHVASLGWNQRTLAVAGDSCRRDTSWPPWPRWLDDEGLDASPPDPLLPSLDLDFDVDRYASLRENAVGYGLETAG